MLDKNLVYDVLTAALSTGGDFAELFLENNAKNSITLINGAVERAQAGIDYGAGIRIFNGTNAIYAYTNDTNRDNLIKVAKAAAGAMNREGRTEVKPLTVLNFENKHPHQVLPKDVKKSVIVEMLKTAHNASTEYDASVKQTAHSYIDSIPLGGRQARAHKGYG
jgi:TldD protein